MEDCQFESKLKFNFKLWQKEWIGYNKLDRKDKVCKL
jgi:hypothetical protein